VEFRILGPLEVRGDRGPLDVAAGRQQTVLATLLLSAGRVVSRDRLLEAVYGEHPPATGRSQTQITISALRRMFADVSGASVIATHPHGYIIQVTEGQLDSRQFAELTAAARAARDAGQLAQAVANYRDALRLWRGPALAGIDSSIVRLAADHLDEQRILVNEDRITLELDMGRHHELVSELTELIEEFPLRERLREQLMIALYRCDRTAEALQAYQDARRVMIEEFGIEPNERLRQLEHAILVSDPHLELAGGRAEIQPAPKHAPRLLPADIADFTGRIGQVETIRRHLVTTAGDESRLAVPLVLISGRGGIGKTSIAVHAAHSIATSFPDGQLFADLHGASHPVSPMHVLDRFLRALGMPGSQIPDTIEERAEAYRDLLAGQKVLVVLDDAANETQVSALVPGGPTAAVIVTSRRRLAGLAGAIQVPLGVFAADSSIELLTRIAGTERVSTELTATAQIAELCGHLPLALRIAGARLSARQHWSIQRLVDRLADEAGRLDEFRYGDMTIKASISLSYEGISEQARRLFRRLAILDLSVFSEWVVAPLLDEPIDSAQDVLDELVGAQLIEAVDVGAHDQYRFHDLILLFARERLAAEEQAANRRTALERALGALLYLAEFAHRQEYGGDYVRLDNKARRWPFPDRVARQLVMNPMSWYEHERLTLISGVRQAGQAGLAELCCGLALNAVTFYESRVYLDDWRETHAIALEAVRQANDVRGEAAMLYSTGTLCMVEQNFGPARQNFQAAARLFTGIGDDHGLALVIRHIAFLDRMNGRLDDAARSYEQALQLLRSDGDQVAVAYVLHGLADVKLEQQSLDAARTLLVEALHLSQNTGNGRVEAQVLHRMGEAHLLAGDAALAADVFDRALEKVRQAGDPIGEAYALRGIGIARIRQGRPDSARSPLQHAITLARAVGDRLVEARVLLGMTELALACGNPAEAADFAGQAFGVFQSAGMPLQEKQALALLSSARALLGREDAASADNE
jgi:DNA-binding SARP family transcriptional activator